MDGNGSSLAEEPNDLVSRLCLSLAQLQDDVDGWQQLAISRGEDNAVLRAMLSQSLTLIHDRERAEAARTGRVIRLLDGLPHVRQSITDAFIAEAEGLRDELLEHV